MADYITINNHSSDGDLAISRKVIQTIVDEAVNRVVGVKIAHEHDVNLASPTEIAFKKDGKVNIKVYVSIKKGINPEEICIKVQEEIAHSLATYTESLPFEIEISIADIR